MEEFDFRLRQSTKKKITRCLLCWVIILISINYLHHVGISHSSIVNTKKKCTLLSIWNQFDRITFRVYKKPFLHLLLKWKIVIVNSMAWTWRDTFASTCPHCPLKLLTLFLVYIFYLVLPQILLLRWGVLICGTFAGRAQSTSPGVLQWMHAFMVSTQSWQ